MIFITGSTGFLGAHITARLLVSGESVRLLRRSSSSIDELESLVNHLSHKSLKDYSEQITWFEGDICEPQLLEQACEGVNAVIHCAATVSFSKSDSERMNQINVEGTETLVNACLQTKVPRLVHISSTSALSNFNKGLPIDESCEYINEEKNSRYGVSKYLGEMEVWRGIEEGLNAVILNPSVILGYGDWDKGSCSLFKQYAQGFPFYSTGSNAFVGVNDVAKIAIQLLDSEIQAERFLCVSENLYFQDVFNRMADGFGQRRPFIKINKVRSEIAWRLFAVVNLFRKRPLITKESANSSIGNIEYSNRKICEALNFSFTPIAEVITKTASAYKSNTKKKLPISE